MSVTKELKWEMAHRLCGYDGLCAHVHGHSYRAMVTLKSRASSSLLGTPEKQSGHLQPDGMLLDFKVIKEQIGKWIDDNWDHAFMGYAGDPVTSAILSTPPVGPLAGSNPRVIAVPWNPTAENMAHYLLTNFSEKFNTPTVYLASVTIYETCTACATAEAVRP